MDNEIIDKKLEWLKSHPYMISSLFGANLVCGGVGYLAGSFAWYLILMGVAVMIISGVAWENRRR